MGISPVEGEAEIINDIRRTYAQAEMSLIKKIANQVQGGKPDIPNWQSRKLAKLDDLTQEVREEIIGETLQDGKEEAAEAVERAYKKGVKDADKNLIAGYGKKALSTTGDLTQIDQESVKALSRGIQDRLNNVDVRVMRTAEDVYRKVIGEASRPGITGAVSRREAAQQALNDFANRGVTGFIDSKGRKWNLSSYTEMATRSTMGRASLNGSMNRMQQNDHDLAIVGTSYEPCELCEPWEQQVLSISGKSNEYPSIADAENAGLWHPNCTHSLSPYIEGVTEPEEKPAEKDHQAYQNRQTQRYNERQIRKWKRRKVAAITDEDEQFTQSKITEWQREQKKFIEETGRYRKYGREQIDQAR